jgi:hypothetical protein
VAEGIDNPSIASGGLLRGEQIGFDPTEQLLSLTDKCLQTSRMVKKSREREVISCRYRRL